ncbi:DUF2185 domain-containing protein [Stenotrophomonas sp. PS02289]|uniref:DUF2185 domain-containing protein n=1 Tax=Stenotrophomonas sp. PS02289 TaxID=2991422 RepID=UPI00249A006D|nr:DUF2185 domain-containing protein [Stenotrophomonas sp. PS02289]
MKKFRLSPDQILHLAVGYGSCMATDRITVDGEMVGYCYREESIDENDSGWRFFCGDEDEEYLGNATNIEIYDVNTIANYDRSVVSVLDSCEGAAFERVDGVLVRLEE